LWSPSETSYCNEGLHVKNLSLAVGPNDVAGFIPPFPHAAFSERWFVFVVVEWSQGLDLNGDGILIRLFLGADAPPCLAAANANGDALADMSDSIWTLQFLFSGGPPPAAPFPQCGSGSAAGDTELGCLAASPDC
jgi:hypothetical protein